jgi:hypothetical protein
VIRIDVKYKSGKGVVTVKYLLILILLAILGLVALPTPANTNSPIYLPVIMEGKYVEPTPEPTPEPTQQWGLVDIVEFHPSSDPQNDYVVLQAQTPNNFTGWRIVDDIPQINYYFPDDFTLGAGEKVNVRSGVGVNSQTDLYMGLDFQAFTNHNCFHLRDQYNSLIDYECIEIFEPDLYFYEILDKQTNDESFSIIPPYNKSPRMMTGWSIWMFDKGDRANGFQLYQFPDFYYWDGAITVYTNKDGEDTAQWLYMGLLNPVLYPDTCIELVDPQDNMHDTYCVPPEIEFTHIARYTGQSNCNYATYDDIHTEVGTDPDGGTTIDLSGYKLSLGGLIVSPVEQVAYTFPEGSVYQNNDVIMFRTCDYINTGETQYAIPIGPQWVNYDYAYARIYDPEPDRTIISEIVR